MKIAYNPQSAGALTKAPADNNITFDLSGLSIYVKGVKFKGTDTTYSVFKKHTSSSGGGYNGLVPVPSYTSTNTRFLREDGSWITPTNTDSKVLQSNTTTSNFRPVILGYNNSTDINDLSTSVTNQVYTTTKIYAQSSTGYLWANKLYSGGKEVLTSHQSLSNYVTINGNQTITGQKIFTNDTTIVRNYLSNSETSQVSSIPSAVLSVQNGYPIYSDPTFKYGTNSCSVYNNLANGNVTLTRISDTQNSANGSGYILEIKNTGTASPGIGGYYQTITSRANAVFAQVIYAKIPIGYTITDAQNSMGTGSTFTWLTTREGTGKWAWYVRLTYCESSGTFSFGGYTYLSGSAGSSSNPVIWYVAFSQVYDITKGSVNLNKDNFKTWVTPSAIGAAPTSHTHTISDITNFTHNHPTSQITSLSGYTKATSDQAVATTDTLNIALGKLAYKGDLGVTAYNLVNAAYDGDGTIENLKEILKVLEGISDTETIKELLGKYLPLTGGTMTGTIYNYKATEQFRGYRNGSQDINSRLTDTEMSWSYTGTQNNTLCENIFPSTNNANGILTFNTHQGKYGHQIGLSSNGELYNRHCLAGTWYNWKKIWNSGNLNPDDFASSDHTHSNYVTTNTAQTISGIKTFTTQQKFTVAGGTAPFTVTSSTVVTNLNADLLDGLEWSNYNLERLYTINASSLDKTKFYPIFFSGGVYNLLLEIYSPGGVGTAEYNTNRFRAVIHSNGWDDSGEALVMLSRYNYQDTEITIGAIGFGQKNGGIAVWVRGGRNYTLRCNRTPSLKTSDYTYGTEIYTVGTNLYGGTNTKVTIKWQNNSDRAKYDVALVSSNVASATKLQTPRSINGTNFDGSANITTAKWGTARSITIGDTTKSVDGSGNVTWTLSEIGVSSDSHNHDSIYVGGYKSRNHGSQDTEYTADTYSSTYVNKNYVAFVERGSWSYANNGYITTDFGNIHLAGTSVFQWGASDTAKTQLFITPLNAHGVSSPLLGEMLYYSSNGGNYASGWTRVVTSRNYTTIITKLGNKDVGSTKNPIYLDAGVPKAISDTIGSTVRPIYLNAGTITQCNYAFGNTSGNAAVNNGTVCTNLNADKLDGYHGSSSGTADTYVLRDSNARINISSLSYTCHSASPSGTAIGWYRIFTFSGNDGLGASVIIHINRKFNSPSNESYTFSIDLAYNGGISITQLSGWANSRLITKIRVDHTNSKTSYVDFYLGVSSNYNNTYYVYGSGKGQFQNPTLVSELTGTAYEFTTVNGFKSDRGITGNVAGNASSATNADMVDNHHASDFVLVAGDTMTGTLNMNNKLYINNSGYIYPYSTSTRTSGMYGVYDSTKIGHIWSMGTGYKIAADGSDFGNLYGFAYKHTNNTTGGTMAGGHMAVWCSNGSPRVALGDYVWAVNGFKKNGSSDSYVLLGNGGHKAISDFMLKSDELTNNLITITKSLTVTSSWVDTGISGDDLSTGTYIVQLYCHASDDNLQYTYYSGVMSWYGGSTNDTETDEILLHRSGHAYGHTLYLRTLMQSNSVLKLQISASTSMSAAHSYIFKFKRII